MFTSPSYYFLAGVFKELLARWPCYQFIFSSQYTAPPPPTSVLRTLLAYQTKHVVSGISPPLLPPPQGCGPITSCVSVVLIHPHHQHSTNSSRDPGTHARRLTRTHTYTQTDAAKRKEREPGGNTETLGVKCWVAMTTAHIHVL